MSERAEDDVRGEQRRAAARQRRHGDRSAAAMAAGGERGSLPSPGAMLGQPWGNWLDAARLNGADDELDETSKESENKREAMRLSREDMPIFGLCPAHDEFYLVMCSHCNLVIKPQAFQSHYERRHSSSGRPPPTPPSTSTCSIYSTVAKNKTGGGGIGGSGGSSTRTSSGSSASSNSKLMKSPKEKMLQIGGNNRSIHPAQQSKAAQDRIMTPPVKVEKIHSNPKIDGMSKAAAGPNCSSTVTSSIKTGLNCPSIPKPPLPSPGQIPNGKGILSTPPFLEKKPDDTHSRKFLHKRLSDREFDPDIHCGVVDGETKKPCTRSLTCKTHSLGYRRAVQGRKKRFDVLLAEHKNKSREKEQLRHAEHQQPTAALREPNPAPSKSSQELHQTSHALSTPEANKAKLHNPSLPRAPSYPAQHSGNAPSDSPSVHESPHPVVSAAEPTSRLSSDEGEADDKEDLAEKLDCHYSDHHPRPAAFCSFGSRQIGRGYYVFDRRWDRMRCALNFMVDKHLNSQMWRKIPPASSSSATHTPHRTPANPPATAQNASGAGFLSPGSAPSCPPSATSPCTPLPHGTTLNSHPSALGAADPVNSMQSRQVSSSPSTPSVLSSSPISSKPQKLKSSKSLKPKEPPAGGANCGNAGSSSGKKRKNTPPPQQLAHPPSHSAETFRKNCVANSGSYPSPATTLSHCSSHAIGLNAANSRTNSVSLKNDQSGRGPPAGNPAESIKRMSVVMNSSDSTLSLGPFVHQASEQTVAPHNSFPHSHSSLDKIVGKKRKCPVASGGINSKPSKIAKLPPVNNVHAKHNSVIPGTQALANNALRHQPKTRP
ncbi:ataxin-7 [Spea bombifrons]|uniref:ataxin-7 n=1 Tax=Spea bombifrons TaxID=233779 RepID=UPI002349C69D|nr:ataxin-7 [Spea bombifrons]